METVKIILKSRKFWKGLSCIAFFICCVLAVVSLFALKNENKEIKAKLEKMENQLAVAQEEEVLTLTCGLDTMVFGETNGINKSGTKNFQVETTYPIVLYQVVGEEGEVLQNEFNEYKGTAKLNRFLLKDVTEEVTEIRLSGFDKEGNQIESRTYEFVFLD